MFEKVDQAVDFINDRDRPLALYLFDNDRRRVESLIDRTRSGFAVSLVLPPRPDIEPGMRLVAELRQA